MPGLELGFLSENVLEKRINATNRIAPQESGIDMNPPHVFSLQVILATYRRRKHANERTDGSYV